MKILITGATGLVGKALTRQLLKQSHQITALTRAVNTAQKLFPEVDWVSSLSTYKNLDQFDAVVNLAGEPIFDKKWTDEQKLRLKNSRILLTQQLTQLINRGKRPPVFISGSASGFYGNAGSQLLTESALPATSFTAELCQAWEAAAQQADTRVCVIRTGMVMSPRGGALARMLPLYRFGLAGKLGSGQQFMPWIALKDMVRGIIFLINNPNAVGAFNFSSPNPVTNKEFNCLLGSRLKRPHFFSVPACILRLFLGERACLLLDSQNVYPKKLLDLGYTFQFEYLETYFSKTLKQKRKK
ncbi:TIGR01777 family oxidoreductase [Basfia succiniciproducens]|uniref:TIGR01777 family protein n=1 Tax=Basfia succiniciproducens TaxID=653940 RepID=A0A1G5AGJ0_9PAST|nr:TIGR01777 family oxidoreductase [Basfia succiniciproducens]QIM68605.1 TIGR01777 family protein [Basfia succiniciproducens]SCX76957.1 hypothetical protein SAMN02910354_00269 [Basfia succiniciproducens]